MYNPISPTGCRIGNGRVRSKPDFRPEGDPRMNRRVFFGVSNPAFGRKDGKTGGKGAPAVELSADAALYGKRTVLLVDDDEGLLSLGVKMLEHLGFAVLTAADGREAVELYRERWKEIDLVLMDQMMPHMDGAEAFDELRKLNPDARVILASGYDQEDVAARFAGKGLDGILQKPYSLLKLRERLWELMPVRSTDAG